MTLITYKTLAAVLIFLIALLAAYYPLKKRLGMPHVESVELGEALASGIFLGATFFHLLPDAMHQFNSLYGNLSLPIPEMICVGGFLLLLGLERLSFNHADHTSHAIPYILIVMLVIHAITEGAALGVGMQLSETLILLIAILAHKGSESYALAMILLRHALPPKRIVFIMIAFALMTPLGILLGNSIHELTLANRGTLIAACFNAFAAGTFLYISTLHHIHFHKHAKDAQGLLEFASLVLGVCAMGLIALWA